MPTLIITVPRTIKSCHDCVCDNEENITTIFEKECKFLFRGKLISETRTTQETPVALENCVSSIGRFHVVIHLTPSVSRQPINRFSEMQENFYLEHACDIGISSSNRIVSSNDYDGRQTRST